MRLALLLGLLLPALGSGQIPDHLHCYGAKDNIPKAAYMANLDGLTGHRCTIRVPAVMLCTQRSESNVRPLPPGGGPSGTPAGAFLCYKVKCPKQRLAAVTGIDQFGDHTIQPTNPRVVCAPLAITGGGPTTTTTTTATSTTTTRTLPARLTCVCDDSTTQTGCAGPLTCDDFETVEFFCTQICGPEHASRCVKNDGSGCVPHITCDANALSCDQ